MAVSLTTLANATTASLLSITTPWVQPKDCETHWSITSASSTTTGDGLVYRRISVSVPAPSCNPSGWDRFGPEDQLKFKPGVCPEGWVYNGMAEDGSPAASTALCCQSNFTDSATWYTAEFFGSRGCAQRTWETALDPAASSTTSERVMRVHEAWAITWAASDTATLTPKLPTLTSSMRVPYWTPGQKIRDGEYDQYRLASSSKYFDDSFLYFLIIGMPILGALMIASCVWCCVRKCKRKRREKKAAIAAGPGPPSTIARQFPHDGRDTHT